MKATDESRDQTTMFDEMVGASAALRTVLAGVDKVAPTDSTVLIRQSDGSSRRSVGEHSRSTDTRGDTT